MSPKVSEEHQTQRRDQIVQAAITCFAKKGFHKTSMKDICHAADLSPGAVYSYFKSKEEIIETVYEICGQENISIFDQTQENHHSMREQVEFNLNGFKTLLMDKNAQPWIKAEQIFRSEVLTNDTLMNIAKGNYQTIIKELNQLVGTWQQQGEVNPELDTRATAQLLFSLVHDISYQKIHDPKLDIEAYFKSAIAIIMGDFKLK
ncbi:MAG: TetR/AcrR family transcriptional regulator [Gammaproteobacteria bacterium]|nr:TetR/AcrR family transcriptional regulator [Gammaproteobacteria bacterium]